MNFSKTIKFRLKYPTLSVNSTALKLVALCLKSANPQQTEENRLKYKHQTKNFISDCLLAQQVEDEFQRRSKLKYNLELMEQAEESKREWDEFHEEHFLRLAEEFQALMKKVKLRNPHEYFMKFIR